MKLLVTGLNGLIGGYIKSYLEETDHVVYSLTRKSQVTFKSELSNIHEINFDLYNGDVNSIRHKIPKIDLVIHMAASAHNTYSTHNINYNLKTTKKVIDLVKGQNPVFVFFSSIAVYGETYSSYPISVDHEPRPTTFYGRSKVLCELELKNIFQKLIILRLCPFVDSSDNKDLLKRIYYPKTKIKIKSPYKREYSFLAPQTLISEIDSILSNYNSIKDVQVKNLKNRTNLNEYDLDIISKSKKSFKPPFLFMKITFWFLKKCNRLSIFRYIESILWKLFRNNTYV